MGVTSRHNPSWSDWRLFGEFTVHTFEIFRLPKGCCKIGLKTKKKKKPSSRNVHHTWYFVGFKSLSNMGANRRIPYLVFIFIPGLYIHCELLMYCALCTSWYWLNPLRTTRPVLGLMVWIQGIHTHSTLDCRRHFKDSCEGQVNLSTSTSNTQYKYSPQKWHKGVEDCLCVSFKNLRGFCESSKPYVNLTNSDYML